MFQTLVTLLRGAVADKGASLADANALAILRQQIRTAASALEVARREFGVAAALHRQEGRAIEALQARIAAITNGARRALDAGRTDLAEEATVSISLLMDECGGRHEAARHLAARVEDLRRGVTDGENRLRDLDRGYQTAQAVEAVRRAGIGVGRATWGGGAIGTAESTLKRLRARQDAAGDAEAATSSTADQSATIESRLGAAGFGPSPRTDPATVLARLRAGNDLITSEQE